MTHSILNGPQWTWKVRMSASRHGLGTSHSKDKRATPRKKTEKPRSGFGIHVIVLGPARHSRGHACNVSKR